MNPVFCMWPFKMVIPFYVPMKIHHKYHNVCVCVNYSKHRGIQLCNHVFCDFSGKNL